MVQRARRKAERAGLTVDWVRGDAHTLPFQDGSFQVVISECALCHLDKQMVLREMLRILRPGGAAGIHDLCWQPDTPQELQAELVDLEEEEPETAAGWLRLFQESGFDHVDIYDRSALIPNWTRQTRAQIGVRGYLRAAAKVLRRWGVTGLWRILAAERIFASPHLGYVIVVGHKPG
jgi:SAM-dependent methyltransferase